MLADIGSPDLYVKENELREVVSGNLFNRSKGIPDENGLVSYEIFGNPGTMARKMTFAYCELGDYFIHPMAYDTLKRLRKDIKELVNGTSEFYISKGKLYKIKNIAKIPSDVKPGTGVWWLKNHWKELDVMTGLRGSDTPPSAATKEKLSFIKSLKPEELFISKWLIMPPYYRDVDMTSSKKNDLNIMYQSILAQANSLKAMGTMFGHQVTDSHVKIQEKLSEMYEYLITFIGGSKAFFQKFGLGKTIDYSARMVISTARITSDSPNQMNVDYAHSATPLAMILECFEPFIEYGFKEWVKQQINGNDYLYTKDADGNLKRIPLASHWEECMLHENIHKLIKLYSDSKEHRLDYFTVEAEDGSRVPLGYITDIDDVTSEGSKLQMAKKVRPITLCELFYIIAKETVNNKQIMVTRFPIEDYQNVYPSLMTIIPYERTKQITINDVTYDRFPDISDEDIAHKRDPSIGEMFNDTLQLFPTYLKALGADFDGDTTTVQGVFSENNTMDYINSPMNFVNIGGSTMRAVTDVISHLLYDLTKTRMEV